jgi:molecular chaperone HtpG
MTQLVLPPYLSQLLAGSPYEAPLGVYADAVRTVLLDNRTPFFPAYTDHGLHHVENVIAAAERLIPDDARSADLLRAEDAAVLVGAALLHDIGLHVHPPGFVALVEHATHEPVAWFSEGHSGRPADAPWPDLWEAFRREAQHMGPTQLVGLLGSGYLGVPNVASQSPLDPGRWMTDDYLLIGEFLRRHHARLAHEIAVQGFPGLSARETPVLLELVPRLANVTGAVARSHAESLRLMVDYLEFLHPGSRRPAGARLPYLMGVLRVADYLQLAVNRAAPLLLRLRRPHSPISIAEWDKHRAVEDVSFDHRDPQAIYVEVSDEHEFRTHLALRELLDDVQVELDMTAAVLSETYEMSLRPLRLSRQRIRSNLDAPGLHEQLPFVPRRAALRSATDLFRLVVADLYGRAPAVAGRELIQNAADAVRARREWEHQTGTPVPAEALRELDADVVVTLEEHASGRCLLRVEDRGIGMTPDVVIDYFLQAGASLAPSKSDLESEERGEALRTMKAGRFGIGAFSAFLLGPEMEVHTRHAGARQGLSFRARIDEDLVELRWADVPVGTEVIVPFRADELEWITPSPGSLIREIAQFYCLMDPSLRIRHVTEEGAIEIESAKQVPLPGSVRPDGWREVTIADFDGVFWEVPQSGDHLFGKPQRHVHETGHLAHNGLWILPSADHSGWARLNGPHLWSSGLLDNGLERPNVAVFDRRHELKLSLQRYDLVDPRLPFEAELLASIGQDVVAHALAAGPYTYPLGLSGVLQPVRARTGWFPLLPGLLTQYAQPMLLVAWVLAREQPLLDADATAESRELFPWDVFPCWVPMPTHAGNVPDTDDEVAWSQWFEEQESHGLAKHSSLLGRELACVVVRSQLLTDDALSADSMVVPTKASTPAVFLKRTTPADPIVERRMIDAARALSAVGSQAIVVLSVFEPPLEALSDRPLATPWIELVGGELPYDDDAREATSATTLRAHPELEALIDEWRRRIR